MIRALVPVNLRPLEEAYRLGNQFGLVFLDLPIGIENPVERLYAVRANMNALKGSFQPVIALGLLAAMGAGPKVLQEELLHALARNGTAVMTNVPGPPQPLYFAGARDRPLPVLGAAVGRHRNGRVDPVVCGPSAVRAHHRSRAVSRTPAKSASASGRSSKSCADHAALAVAARRRSRSRRRGASGNGGRYVERNSSFVRI